MTRSQTELVHRTGSYRAWSLGDRHRCADLAWYCRIDRDRPETHRLLPFCEPSIVVRRNFDAQGITTDCRLLICPAQPDGGTYAPSSGEEQFAVRLAPEAMEAGLGLRAAEYIGGERDLPAHLYRAFEPALMAGSTGDVQQTLALILEGIERSRSAAPRDGVSHAAQILRKSAGMVGASRLAAAVDLSPRHLRREFATRFGLSPRSIARRLRLTSAMMEAEQSARPDWAAIAAGNGFSDQPHMIREFRSILGETPGQFHAKRMPMAVSFNI